MTFKIWVSGIALLLPIISFGIGYWWNRKQTQAHLFVQMTEREAEYATAFRNSRNNAVRDDNVLQYLNFFDSLAHLYFGDMLSKEMTKSYFKEMIITCLNNFPQIYYEKISDLLTLTKLMKEWGIKPPARD